MNKCDLESVSRILNSGEAVDIGGQEIIVKPVPEDGDVSGKMDPREFFIRSAIYAFQKSMPMQFSVEGMRQTTKTYCADMCTKLIAEDSADITANGRTFRLFSYWPAEKKDETLPVMIYIHGGSFLASKAEFYREPCRYVAENLGCRVFNVDYSLAPENVYPAAIEDVCAAVGYIYDNAQALNIDSSKIGLFGDSAGANLALAAIIDNKSEAKISYAGLFYPCVDLYSQDNLYEWNIDMYDVADEQKELINSRLQLGRADGKGNNDLMAAILTVYSGGRYEEVKRNPDVSPIYADLSIMPETGVFTAEYDGLRVQAEYYSRLLDKAGVPNKHIRYRGVSHAFLDYFGILPQAQAALLEMCEQVRKVWDL
ncbi:MAG: alpha/beta hydrolase [Clostridiales bacterium]|nr:alpha/beta hydrolase [Clostridiales bacterium]